MNMCDLLSSLQIRQAQSRTAKNKSWQDTCCSLILCTHLSILRVVHRHRGVALWGGVDVPVVSYRSDGLHGVSSHAGHGDCWQTVPWVIVENVLVLAVQQQDHGLLENGQKKEYVTSKQTEAVEAPEWQKYADMTDCLSMMWLPSAAHVKSVYKHK